MLTVRDVMADLDIELLAGAEGLAAPVRWVHISELPDPTPFLSGGELEAMHTFRRYLDSEIAGRITLRVAEQTGAVLGAGAGSTDRRRRCPRSRPTATSGPSSCCSRFRTPTRCGSTATRCSARSSRARVTTEAS